jgi:thymidylate synthase
MSSVDYGFLKGIGISLVIIVGYKIYTDQKIKEMEHNSRLQVLNSKFGELESRIENLEDFKFRFYQLYTTARGLHGTGVWNEWNDDEDSELESSDDDEEI